MNKLNLFPKNLIKYFFFFLSTILFFFIVWFRFIRKRLLTEIPLQLTTLKFFIIIFIIYSLLYITIISLFNINVSKVYYINKIYKPLIYLDQNLKKCLRIKQYSEKVLMNIYNVLKNNSYYINNIVYFEYFIRILTCLTFITEIFYMQKLHYVYKLVYFYIIIYIIKYFYYYFGSLKEEQSKYLNDIVRLHWNNSFGLEIDIDSFIEKQSNFYIEHKTFLAYDIWIKESYIIKATKDLNITINQKKVLNIKVLSNSTKKLLLFITHINILLVRYLNLKKNYKYLDLLLNILFLIGWIYTLMKSIHTLSMDSVIWLRYLYPKNDNPFC